MVIFAEDCLRCSQEYCNSSMGVTQNECHIIEGSLLSNCDCGASLIKCNNAAAEDFPLADPDSNCVDNLFNTSLSDGTESSITSGLYIFRSPRFCEYSCLHKITLHTDNFDPLLNGSSSLLKIHIYKRYGTSAQFRDGLMAEQYSFNATLNLINEVEDIVEATVEDPAACFENGDYLGFTIGENLTIRIVTNVASLTNVLDGLRMYDSNVVTVDCNSSRPVLDLQGFGAGAVTQLPVMTIIFRGKCDYI